MINLIFATTKYFLRARASLLLGLVSVPMFLVLIDCLSSDVFAKMKNTSNLSIICKCENLQIVIKFWKKQVRFLLNDFTKITIFTLVPDSVKFLVIINSVKFMALLTDLHNPIRINSIFTVKFTHVRTCVFVVYVYFIKYTNDKKRQKHSTYIPTKK